MQKYENKLKIVKKSSKNVLFKPDTSDSECGSRGGKRTQPIVMRTKAWMIVFSERRGKAARDKLTTELDNY